MKKRTRTYVAARAREAMLQMQKIDVKRLEKAAGEARRSS